MHISCKREKIKVSLRVSFDKKVMKEIRNGEFLCTTGFYGTLLFIRPFSNSFYLWRYSSFNRYVRKTDAHKRKGSLLARWDFFSKHPEALSRILR